MTAHPFRTLLGRLFGARGGNFAVFSALMAVPVFLSVGAAIDFNEALRSRQQVQSAVDAASLIAAREFSSSATPEKILAAARPYFDANIAGLDAASARLFYDGTIQDGMQRTLKMHATYSYEPQFLGLAALLGGEPDGTIAMTLYSDIVIGGSGVELAMVLDNSGSMRWYPENSSNAPVGQRRIDVLKTAADDLVKTLLGESTANSEAVKIGVIPFSTSVNVGKRFAGASWIDTDGRSPIHHENFDWSTWTSAQPITETIGGTSVTRWRLNGTWLTRQWLLENATATASNTVATTSCAPFTLLGLCNWTSVSSNGSTVWTLKLAGVQYCTSATNTACWPTTTRTQSGSKVFSAWEGCFEARPNGFAETDAAPDQNNPQTLFVPFFAPDEHNWANNDATNDMVNDYLTDKTTTSDLVAHRNMTKYVAAPSSINGSVYSGYEPKGPNKGCIDTEILPLTGTTATVLAKIGEMVPSGSTNIPEGIAWGWRVLTPGVPFTEGKPKNDAQFRKVLLIMTDGENTYYDANGITESSYGAYGYSKVHNAAGSSTAKGRIYAGTSRNGYDTTTYNRAMNDHMAVLCENVKNDGILVATITLSTGQPSGKTGDAANVSDRLKACASYSPKDGTKKMFYYASTASELKTAFAEFLLQISSLRIAH